MPRSSAVKGISNEINGNAKILTDKFWPGPVTLIFKKKPGIPGWVGGHPSRTTETVAVRAPANETARELIKKAGRAIAAPSANKAGTPSPTRAEHVAADFAAELKCEPRVMQTGGKICREPHPANLSVPKYTLDMILDGGETVCGLESTVADMTGPVPRVLRPGAVTVEMLEDALGCKVEVPETHDDSPPPSPGMKYRHYAPVAPMTVVYGKPEKIAEYINQHCIEDTPAKKIGILATEQTLKTYREHFNNNDNIRIISAGSKTSPETVAHNLYDCLRQFDGLGVDEIFAEGFDETGIGRAIMNRMKKASEGRVIHA